MLTDEVTLTKGGCLLTAAGMVITNFIFLFAVLAIVGDTKQTELNAIQIREAREDVQAVHMKLDELNKTLANQAVRDAEIKGRDFGYRVGRSEQQKPH